MPDVTTEVTTAVRDAVPFVAIMAVWSVVMLVMYGVFLVTKPDTTYPTWAYASVFVPGLIGYLGHTLRQALSVRQP